MHAHYFVMLFFSFLYPKDLVIAGDSLALYISNETSQDCQVHSILRSSAIPSWPVDEIRQIPGDFSFDIDKRRNLVSAFTNKKSLRKVLPLESTILRLFSIIIF